MTQRTNRTEKLDLRLSRAAKKTLQAAATAQRKSVSEFVLDIALSEAEERLADRRVFTLEAKVNEKRHAKRISIGLLLFLTALAGCVPAGNAPPGSGPEPSPQGPKRITATIRTDGAGLWEGTGGRSLIELFTAGLVSFDAPGEPIARNAFSMKGMNSVARAFPQGPLFALSAKTWWPVGHSGSRTT